MTTGQGPRSGPGVPAPEGLVLHDATDDPQGLNSSVGKALRLLEAFTPQSGSMGLTEIAKRSGLPKSTAYRLLSILSQRGLIARKGTTYSIGPRVLELASSTTDSPSQYLRHAATPFVQDLYRLTHGETVHLAVLDGASVFYLDKVHGHERLRSPSKIGGRVPAGCSALGKAILAFDDESTARVTTQLRPLTPYSIVAPAVFTVQLRSIRESGVAFDHEEAAIGLTCVAAPVLSKAGRPVGAVSVSGPVHRFRPSTYAEEVRRAASGIARALAVG